MSDTQKGAADPGGSLGSFGSSGSGPQPTIFRVLTFVVAVITFALMALTFVDVIGRYFFSAPVPGAFEITSYLLALLVFAGMSLVTRDREHITVTLMEGLFKGRIKRIQQFVIFIASAVVLTFIAERMWHQARDSHLNGDLGEYFDVEIAPVLYVIAILSIFTCVTGYIVIWRHFSGQFEEPDTAKPIEEVSDIK